MFKGEAFSKRSAIYVIAAMSVALFSSALLTYECFPLNGMLGPAAVDMPHLFLTNMVKSCRRNSASRLRNKDDILCAKAIRGTQSARWEGQTFYLIFDVQYADTKQGVVTETVRFIGRRVWFDTYKWGVGIAVNTK